MDSIRRLSSEEMTQVVALYSEWSQASLAVLDSVHQSQSPSSDREVCEVELPR
jgi:hypothetical protein